MLERLSEQTRHRLFLLLVFFVFFSLLGTRGLNEPDEGRYGEIAREMVQTGDWLVPHIWYVPHLDKPPMTYWCVAASFKLFGVSEWSLRLPLALAGLSGAWATWLLALSVAGRGAARWSVLILSVSILYAAMARMLTTDIFLTQFVAWTVYFFWRGWRCLDVFSSDDAGERGRAGRQFVGWQAAMWAAIAGGFLTKGPLALILPLFAAGPLLWLRRREGIRWSMLALGTLVGLAVFSLLALPWYLMVFQAEPESFRFMVVDQIVGHATGGGAKNRSKPFFFFFGILAVGFLPWTILLGWLWHKAHWRSLTGVRREAWAMLCGWAVLTFAMFSINSSKLPAYILPMFPALALLVTLRWRLGETAPKPAGPEEASMPDWVWRAVGLSPFVPMIAMPLIYRFAFRVDDQNWIWIQVAIAAIAMVAFGVITRAWPPSRCRGWAVGLGAFQLTLLAAMVPRVETELRSNQTLKEIGGALTAEYNDGDALVIWHRLPQGLPLYAQDVITPDNRPYLAGLPLHRIPFEYPVNQERMGDLVITNRADVVRMLEGDRRVLVVGWRNGFRNFQESTTNTNLRLLKESGTWELYSNR